jgi:hypothetical protein
MEYIIPMTEIVRKIRDDVKNIKAPSTEEISSFFEMAFLVGTFLFCIYAVSPIV